MVFPFLAVFLDFAAGFLTGADLAFRVDFAPAVFEGALGSSSVRKIAAAPSQVRAMSKVKPTRPDTRGKARMVRSPFLKATVNTLFQTILSTLRLACNRSLKNMSGPSP